MLSPYDHEILAAFRDGPGNLSEDRQEDLLRLYRKGYLRISEFTENRTGGSSEFDPICISSEILSWELTPEGRAALPAADEVRRHHAEENDQQRKLHHLAVCQLILSVLSFLFGAFAEYRFELAGWLLSLFG